MNMGKKIRIGSLSIGLILIVMLVWPAMLYFITATVGGVIGSLAIQKLNEKKAKRAADKLTHKPAASAKPPLPDRDFFNRGDGLVHEEKRLEADLADVRRRRAEYETAL